MRRLRGPRSILLGRAFPVAFAVLAGGALGSTTGCWGSEFTAGAAGAPGPQAEGGGGDAPEESSLVMDAGEMDAGEGDASTTWCTAQARTHTFCDDFDTLPLPSNFTRSSTSSGATLAEDSTVSWSPPNSLIATTPLAVATNSSDTALLLRTFLHDGSHFVFQAEFRIAPECLAGAGYVAPVGIYFADYTLALLASASGADLIELSIGPDGGANGANPHTLRTAVVPGRWFTLAMDARLGAVQTVDMTIDGTPVLTGEKMTLLPPTPPVHPTLVVGASVNSMAGAAATGCTVHVDNVLLDVKVL